MLCSICHTILVEQNVIAAKGHSSELVEAKDATCTEDGNDIVLVASGVIIYGDIDGNGKVNSFDAINMTSIVKGNKENTNPIATDVDFNGKTNAFDVIAMKKMLKGSVDYSKYYVATITE